MIDDRTSNLNLPKPNQGNTLLEDVGRLRTALDGIDTAVAGKENTSSKGAANGYAGLDGGGKVPAAQLPSVPSLLGFTPEDAANKGAANGYAGLDSGGKVPASQLPSYVDDVLEYASLAGFPGTGSSGIIYVALDTNKTYRWGGSAYVEISASPGSTDAVPEGSTNLYFTPARARAAQVPATASTLGVVKVGSGLSVGVDGTLSAIGGGAGTGTPAFNELTIIPSSNGQTVFTPSGGYTAGTIELFLNGVLLYGNGDDYTANDGTTITLTAGVNTTETLLLRRWTTTINLPFSALADKPTTLSGYGITAATQADAEAGTDDTKPVTPLRVAQAIAALGTPASAPRVVIANTATSPTLPDLTKVGGLLVVAPENAAAVPSTITTSDGWTVATQFSPNVLSAIAPVYQGIAHGVWLNRTMRPPTLASFTGLGTGGTYIASCQLDANLVVVLFKGSGNTTWAVAINTATNSAGTPVQLEAVSPVATNVAIFADTTTTFVAFYGSGRACAGSVSGLTITAGAAVGVDNGTDVPKRLSSGVYLGPGNASGSSPRPISVSGTTITVGASVSLGPNSAGARISRISDSTALVVYTSTGGGSNSTRALSAVVGTISSGVLTFGLAATQASNNNGDGAIRLLQPYVDGSSWLVCTLIGSGSNGGYSAITVSGSNVTIGAQTVRLNDVVPSTWANRFDVYNPATSAIRYNASTILLGHLSTGPYAITISGTTLTFGASGGPATTVNFLTDFSGVNFYAVGPFAFDKISVSGSTITSNWQVAGQPAVIASDTLNNRAVSYDGVWYYWTLPGAATLITADKWLLNTGATTTILGGPVQ